MSQDRVIVTPYGPMTRHEIVEVKSEFTSTIPDDYEKHTDAQLIDGLEFALDPENQWGNEAEGIWSLLENMAARLVMDSHRNGELPLPVREHYGETMAFDEQTGRCGLRFNLADRTVFREQLLHVATAMLATVRAEDKARVTA